MQQQTRLFAQRLLNKEYLMPKDINFTKTVVRELTVINNQGGIFVMMANMLEN